MINFGKTSSGWKRFILEISVICEISVIRVTNAFFRSSIFPYLGGKACKSFVVKKVCCYLMGVHIMENIKI